MEKGYLDLIEEVLDTFFLPENSSITLKNANNYKVEELDNAWELKVPMVGVSEDQIQIKVKAGVLFINNEENVFTPDVNIRYWLPVVVGPEDIEVILRDGILTVVIDKPDNYEFDLTVGE